MRAAKDGTAVFENPERLKGYGMLKQRVKAALIFVPLVLILIYLGGWAFNISIIVILLLAAYEYAVLFNRVGFYPSRMALLLGVLVLTIQRWVFIGQYESVPFLLVWLLTIITSLIQYELGSRDAAINFAITLAGIFYIGWVGGFFITLRVIPNGLGWMLTALPATWLADSGAYFIGKWLGKRQMTPRLSPHKTWAGYIGAMLTGTASGLLLVLLWRAVGFLPAETPLWQGLVMGFALSALTPVGDLLISLFKRTAGVKDTSSLIPGHGGILDRIDTWIWAAMLGYFLVIVF
jgi:phosphatidate cytidylyltransferase